MTVNLKNVNTILFAVDTGGTFTDLLVKLPDGSAFMFKASTTPDDPIRGVLDALQIAADDFGIGLSELLSKGERLVHGTTHALNAIMTGKTAKTALLVTKGHPDILTLREGGRAAAFNYEDSYPEPYVPRELTYEVPGRIRVDGSEMTELDEAAVSDILNKIASQDVEAIAVCFLWSISNSAHEKRVGEMIQQRLPDLPFTLSHEVNPSVREFRRASSTVVDASLKPLMGSYMAHLDSRLKQAGFNGRVLVVTSQAGVIDSKDAAEAPIHIVNSGPSMAPIAGRQFGELEEGAKTIVVADTGGTTYDVSLVREGRIPTTRDTWIGPPFRGVMIGFPWVDVKSVGAGGGSIAWVDAGGLLHVGPQSAGAVPGPVAYGQGGTEPTVSDASLVLGHLDPANFLGGRKKLDLEAAKAAIDRIGKKIFMSREETANAILDIATENMAQAIVDITVSLGVDPQTALLVGGGGAAGLNSVRIARRLGCKRVLFPQTGPVLSAAGASISDLKGDFRTAKFVSLDHFDHAAVTSAIDELQSQAEAFVARSGHGAVDTEFRYSADARYATQVWEIEVPLGDLRLKDASERDAFREVFHRAHKSLFSFDDPSSDIEILGWSVEAICKFPGSTRLVLANPDDRETGKTRRAWFPGAGWCDVALHKWSDIAKGTVIEGPAIVESNFSTVVVEVNSRATKRSQGGLSVEC